MRLNVVPLHPHCLRNRQLGPAAAIRRRGRHHRTPQQPLTGTIPERLLGETRCTTGRLREPELGDQGDRDQFAVLDDSQIGVLNLGDKISGVDFVQLENEMLDDLQPDGRP